MHSLPISQSQCERRTWPAYTEHQLIHLPSEKVAREQEADEVLSLCCKVARCKGWASKGQKNTLQWVCLHVLFMENNCSWALFLHICLEPQQRSPKLSKGTTKLVEGCYSSSELWGFFKYSLWVGGILGAQMFRHRPTAQPHPIPKEAWRLK